MAKGRKGYYSRKNNYSGENGPFHREERSFSAFEAEIPVKQDYGRYGTEAHPRVDVTSYGSSSRYASTGGFNVNADEWSAEPFFMRNHEMNLLDRHLKHDDKVRSDDRDHELKKLDLSHSWGAAREAASYDHNFAMASLRSRTQRELQAKHENSKTERFLFGNLFQHKIEKARHKASARVGELALARDKARYRHIARENKKAAKRERRRIVVQRGYY